MIDYITSRRKIPADFVNAHLGACPAQLAALPLAIPGGIW
jgi:hypothetical protein